mmetsp:Transcript_4776/g.12305  ORF Transcript_4776/g.12305 Transcript_4776/m.12305 type:complete len:103 (+) Transcript_4776:401-709(+)
MRRPWRRTQRCALDQGISTIAKTRRHAWLASLAAPPARAAERTLLGPMRCELGGMCCMRGSARLLIALYRHRLFGASQGVRDLKHGKLLYVVHGKTVAVAVR